MSEIFQTDVAIIGAGPVGLFAVFQCGMLGMTCHVFDSLDHIGGQCTALYPEKPIYDIPAAPAISAAALIEHLERQAAPFAPVYHLGQTVTQVSGQAGDFTLMTSAGKIAKAKAIVIAAGAGAFGPHRPPLDNLAEYEGTSVFYSIRHTAPFAGQRLVIAGGGDSAVEVRGTAFTTRVEHDHLMSVDVQHGRVEVRPPDGRALLLGAGAAAAVAWCDSVANASERSISNRLLTACKVNEIGKSMSTLMHRKQVKM